mgnify:CR=1 FL=1
MKIYSTLNIGAFHTNHCEDFLVNEQIATKERLIAVLDGCTMGTESVFASMLYGKILRKISKDKFYEEFVSNKSIDPKSKLKEVVLELMTETKRIKNQLGLETNELLSTLIIGIVNTEKHGAEFLAIGDGMIFIDGKSIEYEQDDKPDYLGYHLSDNFDKWFESQEQKLSVSKFEDISICTDGIYTFKNFKNSDKQMSEAEIKQFLLGDNEHLEMNNFLEHKMRYLKDELNHVVTDDLAIIRVRSAT